MVVRSSLLASQLLSHSRPASATVTLSRSGTWVPPRRSLATLASKATASPRFSKVRSRRFLLKSVYSAIHASLREPSRLVQVRLRTDICYPLCEQMRKCANMYEHRVRQFHDKNSEKAAFVKEKWPK